MPIIGVDDEEDQEEEHILPDDGIAPVDTITKENNPLANEIESVLEDENMNYPMRHEPGPIATPAMVPSNPKPNGQVQGELQYLTIDRNILPTQLPRHT